MYIHESLKSARFVAYYAHAKPRKYCVRTYGGVRTRDDALDECVLWLEDKYHEAVAEVDEGEPATPAKARPKPKAKVVRAKPSPSKKAKASPKPKSSSRGKILCWVLRPRLLSKARADLKRLMYASRNPFVFDV
jgi:hypothetical protein